MIIEVPSVLEVLIGFKNLYAGRCVKLSVHEYTYLDTTRKQKVKQNNDKL